jgi:uncharacterized protein YegL
MRPPALALLALLTLPSLLAPALAQGAEASTPVVPPGRNTVWTVMNVVEAVVRDNYATVQVIAEIGNRGPDPEFPFQVRVPDDAFVTGLTITRDGQVHEARIEERQAARQEYDAHKRREMTGGLVEKTRGTSVYSFLVNVGAFESVRAVLTYERYLAAEEGAYRLPLEAPVSGFGQDLGARFEVRVGHADGILQAWGSAGTARQDHAGVWHLTHQVGPRQGDAATPFEAHYELPPTPDEGSLAVHVQDGKGWFAHRFRAPADARTLPLDLVLVLDVSGSMSGLKMQQMQDAAAQVVQLLGPEDRLHLVSFSSEARSPWSGLRPADPAQRRLAADEVRALVVAGGTNIEAGMRRGFAAFEGVDWAREEGRMPLLVFLTDGQPTNGITDKAALRAEAREANARGVPVFALAFGRDADWGLVAGLAADGKGFALRVAEGQGAEVDLRRFMAALTTPVLRNVTLHYQGALEAHHRLAPILFAGSELLVVGRFDPSAPALRGEVRALGPDGTRAYPFEVATSGAAAAPFLPRLVAYEEIRRLQALEAADGASPAVVGRIKALALEHGFVTDHTSLVVTLPEQSRAAPCAECDGFGLAAESSRDRSAGAPSAANAGGASGSGGVLRQQPSSLESKQTQATPGFEALGALAAVGLAVLALRRGGFRR